jgi:hypothetical protein
MLRRRRPDRGLSTERSSESRHQGRELVTFFVGPSGQRLIETRLAVLMGETREAPSFSLQSQEPLRTCKCAVSSTTHISLSVPMEAAAVAHRQIASGHSRGRVVLAIS